jgi:hypothetical protein
VKIWIRPSWVHWLHGLVSNEGRLERLGVVSDLWRRQQCKAEGRIGFLGVAWKWPGRKIGSPH